MIAVFADAPADISPQLAAQLDIRLLPARLHFAGEAVPTGELSAEEVLRRIREGGQIPRSSTLGAEAYAQAYARALETHNEVISVHAASTLGPSYTEAVTAAAQFSGRVHVIDSLSSSFATGMQAIRAARMRDDGYSAHEILAELDKVRGKQFVHFVADTLAHLRLSGRVSGLSATMGGLLGVKPLFKLEGGQVHPVGRTRGQRGMLEALAEALITYAGQAGSPIHVAYLYTAGGKELAQQLQAMLSSWGYAEMGLYELGPLQTALVGPAAVGIAAEPMAQHSRHRARGSLDASHLESGLY